MVTHFAKLHHSLLLVVVGIAECSLHKAFMDFLRSDPDGAKNLDVSKVEVKEGQYGQRGLFALKDLAADEVVLQVPFSRMITATNAADRLKGCGVPADSDIEDISGIAMAVLIERDHQRLFGNESKYRAFIEVLPAEFDIPVSWPPEQLDFLKGSSVYIAVKLHQVAVDSMYEDVVRWCPEFGRLFRIVDWRWALQVATSRTFKLHSRTRGRLVKSRKGIRHLLAMVPFADFANHHERPNTTWRFDDDKDSFVMITTDEYSKGSEVFDTYGEKVASAWLEGYGFIPEGHEDDVTPILTRIPLCLPPSVIAAHEQMGEKTRGLVKEVLNVTLAGPCCKDDNLDDAACYSKILTQEPNPESEKALFLTIGPRLIGSTDNVPSKSQLARILAHFRLLALTNETQLRCFASQQKPSVYVENATLESLAEWNIPCTNMKCFPASFTRDCAGSFCPHLLPISKENEAGALKLLAALMSAGSSILSKNKLLSADEKIDSRQAYRKSLARKYLQLEDNTYRRHLQLIDFVLPLLKFGRNELKDAVCQHASTANMTARFVLRDFASYLDSVVAPLAFLPFPEDAPCSVVHTEYALSKSCLEQEMHAGIDRMIDEFGLADLMPDASKKAIHPHDNSNEL